MQTDVRNLTKMALFVAILCVSAYIAFPSPFSPGMFAIITLVMCLIAFLLPPKECFITFIVYVLLGAIGLPVFVGGTAGLGKILGPTGGFIVAWPFAYTLLSYWKGDKKSFIQYAWRSIVITIGVSYIVAVAWFAVSMNLSLWAAFVGMAPYIPGDMIKCVIAAWLATKISI